MDLVDAVTPDELRRAFTVAVVADAGSPGGPSLEDVLVARFPDDRIDALMARVLLVFLWLEGDDAVDLIGPSSPLGVPELHPAVYDVAAAHPIPRGNLPKPAPFYRELAKRVRLYDVMTRPPA